MKTLPALLVSALLLTGCVPRQQALLDPNQVHQIAKPATIQVWVRRPDGQLVAEPVTLEAGWYVASPAVIDPPTVAH